MTAYKYEYSVPMALSAGIDDAFAALISPAALAVWFAEHVEIEPRVGGAFRFWGRYSYEPRDQNAAAQQITRLEPPHMLAFTWRLLGQDSEVTWILTEAGERESKITVTHAFPSLPDIGRAKELVDDLWRFHTGNLCFYLGGEHQVVRLDFDDPHPEVRLQIIVEAPPEKVFAALTTPEYIKKWFPAPAPLVEPRLGGKYTFGFSFEKDGETVEAPPMTIIEYEPNRKLAISWPDWRGDASVPDQKVAWTLDDLGGRTRVTLIHSGFTRAVDVSDYPFGWVEFAGKIRGVSEAI